MEAPSAVDSNVMTFPRPTFRTLACLLVFGAAALAVRPGSAAAPPAWRLVGPYDFFVDAPVESLAFNYGFDFEGTRYGVRFAYDDEGGIGGTVFVDAPVGFSLLVLAGTSRLDGDGVQRVHIEDSAGKQPGFAFDGTVDPITGDLIGEYAQVDGFLGFTGARSGPFTFQRADQKARNRSFRLKFAPEQDGKGAVRGKPDATSGKVVEQSAEMTVFGGYVLTGGKVRGRVKTSRDGTTSGKVRIKGRHPFTETRKGKLRTRYLRWKVTLAGPIDAQGFHAVVDAGGRGLDAKGVPITLVAEIGATPEPAPGAPPPKNLAEGGTAQLVSGGWTLRHEALPKSFFGKKTQLIVRFAQSDGLSVVHAVPASFSLGTIRHVIANVGSTTYNTQTLPADVSISIRRAETSPGGIVEVLLTGTVIGTNGKSKPVDVLLRAVVQ